MIQSQETVLGLWETRIAKRVFYWRTHHVGRFKELAVGLIGLETPRHSCSALHHFTWCKGATEDASGTVFHDHHRIGMDFDGWWWLRHCKIECEEKTLSKSDERGHDGGPHRLHLSLSLWRQCVLNTQPVLTHNLILIYFLSYNRTCQCYIIASKQKHMSQTSH